MKLTVEKKGLDIIPCNSYDANILEKLKDGIYLCELKKPRLVKHNAKYWLLCQAMAFHNEGATSEKWHRFFKNTFLGYDELKMMNGRTAKLESSTAFDNLDQNGFDEYYQKIEQWLNENGMTVDELIQSSK